MSDDPKPTTGGHPHDPLDPSRLIPTSPVEPEHRHDGQESSEANGPPLYYVPNEYLLHVDHAPGWFTDTAGQFDSAAFLNTLRESYGDVCAPHENLARTPPIRVASGEREFTLIPVKWDGERTVEDVLTEFNRRQAANDGGVLEMNDPEQRAGTLIGALPNWHIGADSHSGIGTHGPAMAPRGIQTVTRLGFEDTAQSLGEHSGVDVYILDAIPPVNRVLVTSAKWQSSTRAPVYQGMVTPKIAGQWLSSRSIGGETYAAFESEQACFVYARPGVFDDIHPGAMRGFYESSDHGLFIAGIVHGLVPDARLFVIQVLNDYGVGTFASLAAGFDLVAKLRAESPDRHAVINCSFVLGFPPDAHAQADGYDVDMHDYTEFRTMPPSALDSLFDGGDESLNTPSTDPIIASIKALLKAIRSSIAGNGTGDAVLVAAVGNDSVRNSTPRKIVPARYPAALTYLAQYASKVVAVGALKAPGSANDVASYSNVTPMNGLRAFGGEFDETSGEGIAGLYTKPAPRGSASIDNGFAEWAGTSFATAYVTGKIAEVSLKGNVNPIAAAEGLRDSNGSGLWPRNVVVR
jgi:hypothetical protein